MAAAAAPSLPRLHHALSSYYSMIARLALAEGHMAYTPVLLDIHAHLAQQRPDYVRLNPNMTVPTLELPQELPGELSGELPEPVPGRVLTESRAIALYALGLDEAGLDEESRAWLDLHYALPIEELTFGRLLARSRLARAMVPRALARARRGLRAQAARHPDLAPLYTARAAVFTERLRVFDPAAAAALATRRQAQAVALLERMAHSLGDGRATLIPNGYGIADVVMTVFLGRMVFTGLGAEIASRPALARYWQAMQARPNFAQADIWTRFQPWRALGGIFGLTRR